MTRRASFVAAVLLVLAPAIALAADIETLPVPNVTIYPGDTINDGMIVDGRFSPGTAASLPILASRVDVLGKVARRTLLAGRLIPRNAVAEPELVQKGSIVPAVYQSGDLVITASVVALQSGALDQAIQARNVDSGKIIFGSVQADGTIRIAGE